jgi:hypothetical protein
MVVSLSGCSLFGPPAGDGSEGLLGGRLRVLQNVEDAGEPGRRVVFVVGVEVTCH